MRKILIRIVAPLAAVVFAVGLPAVAFAQPQAATAPVEYEIGPITVCTIYPILWTEICI